MCKAENSLSRLIDPSNHPDDEISLVKQRLQELGFSETDQAWLVEVFKRSDCFGDPTGKYVFRHEIGAPDVADGLNSFKRHVQNCKDSHITLALLFSTMLGFGPRFDISLLPNKKLQKSNGSWNIPQWVTKFQKHAAFCANRLDLHKLRETPNITHAPFYFDNLLFFLFPEGVPLDQIVDLELLSPIRRLSLSSNDFKNPNELEYWLKWRFSANAERCEKVRLDTLLPVFSNFSDEVLGNKILGLLNAIEHGMRIGQNPDSGERLDPLNDGWRVVTSELIPFLELLSDRKPELKQERSPLLKAWWHLSKIIYSWSMGGLESELSDELRKRLVESASRHIGILRSILKDTPEVFAAEDAPGVLVSDFYDKAFYVLLSFASPWKRLKPLFLAFTEMREQAVSGDLRTWREHDSTENPPEIYSRVPNWIEVAMYPQNLQAEIEKDPDLKDLREEFSKFCLSRLRTRTKNKKTSYIHEDFVEPRPVWRGCYIQALKALRVNPGGRAHRTLFWLLNNDPDEGVREYARRAHRQVRHLDRNTSNLEEGSSPRRPLFEAFWWMRQAHLITLGIDVDQAGAMRTRRTELHRTREKDDRYKRKR